MTAGPNGAAAVAGWQMVPRTGQVPMVARYAAAGRKWVRTLTTQGWAYGVAIDRAGNVYVAATVNPSARGDIAVVKYSATGAWRWTRTYNGGDRDAARRIAVDRSGNVVAVG